MVTNYKAIKPSKIYDLTNPIIRAYEGKQSSHDLVLKVTGVATMIMHRLGFSKEEAIEQLAMNWDTFVVYDNKCNPTIVNRGI